MELCVTYVRSENYGCACAVRASDKKQRKNARNAASYSPFFSGSRTACEQSKKIEIASCLSL